MTLETKQAQLGFGNLAKKKADFEVFDSGMDEMYIKVHHVPTIEYLKEQHIILPHSDILKLSDILFYMTGWCKAARKRASDRGLAEFVTLLDTEIGKLKEKSLLAVEEGKLSFYDCYFFLSDIKEIVVVRPDQTSHLVSIHNVNVNVFNNKVDIRVSYEFLDHNYGKYKISLYNLPIWGFLGTKTFEQLGLLKLTSELEEELAANGRHFVELTKNGRSHCQIKRGKIFGGVIDAREGFTPLLNTRIMVDRDNWEHFHGVSYDYGQFQRSAAEIPKEELLKDTKKLCMCSPYVYGFAFNAKVWGRMSVKDISPIVFRDDAFDRLSLEPERKQLLELLVTSKLDNFQDLVDGKSGGSVILLSGPPGSGKTLTAETIAEKLHRPIYVVNVGELGVKPEDLEIKLKKAFTIAESWEAVLLIDECDIFLEKRTKDDVVRNALVGIFLRELEYYKGILFLSTNRIGEIDEAFFSRILMAFRYEKLEADKRLTVWKELSKEHDFENVDWEDLSKVDLNGREIKHCIKLALLKAKAGKRSAVQSDIEYVIGLMHDFKHN